MLKIIHYGREELRKPCEPIKKEEFNEDLIQLCNEMYQMMLKAQGVGLAANQIGINKKIAIIQVKNGQRIDLINPEIQSNGPIMEEEQEGCLSIPKIFSFVNRYKFIKVKAFNVFGEKLEFKAKDLLARVLQHEIDHLNGFLYIDRLSKANQKKLDFNLKNLNPKHVFLKPHEI